jgi:hypothetical protein
MSHALSGAVLTAVAREVSLVSLTQAGVPLVDFTGEIWKGYQPGDVVRRVLNETSPGIFAAELMRNAVSRGTDGEVKTSAAPRATGIHETPPPWYKPGK